MPKVIVWSLDSRPRRGDSRWIVLMVCTLGLACASAVPKELNDARDAYSFAAEEPSASNSVTQLRTAQRALELAERTFREEGNSPLTRERSREALRAARLAAAQAKGTVAQAEEPLSTPQSHPAHAE